MLEKIDLLKIDGFKNHPYKVNDDESLKELASSIKENGLLNPLISDILRQKSILPALIILSVIRNLPKI